MGNGAEFKAFCNDMWRENCKERFQFGEEELTFSEYVTNNIDFIFEEYKKTLDNS